MDDNEYEQLEIDEDSEDLAYALTLIAKKINPKVNLGRVYEIYVTLLVQLINGYTVTDEDFELAGQKMLDSVGQGDGDLH